MDCQEHIWGLGLVLARGKGYHIVNHFSHKPESPLKISQSASKIWACVSHLTRSSQKQTKGLCYWARLGYCAWMFMCTQRACPRHDAALAKWPHEPRQPKGCDGLVHREPDCDASAAHCWPTSGHVRTWSWTVNPVWEVQAHIRDLKKLKLQYRPLC